MWISFYVNNSNDYLSVGVLHITCFLGIGSNCGVYFVHNNRLDVSFIVVAVTKWNLKSNQSKCGQPLRILHGIDEGTWWLAQV